MLLIWDVHLSAKIKPQLLPMLKGFIESHSEENNIVFLWDYIYHFSYDRTSLLELFQYFLELYKQWKTLYILSGNHDRIGENFVFEEGKKVFDLLEKNGTIHFITSPLLTEIENEKILFLPFSIHQEYDENPEYKTPLIESLLESKNKNEVISGKLNATVNKYIKENEKLTIIHHHYINKTNFPWYHSTFAYKDIALSEELLDNPNIKLISWHLHAPFVYKNYLCTWSLWPTSSLESNHLKWYFIYSNWTFSFYAKQPVHYLEMENINQTSSENITSLYNQCTQKLKQILKSSTILKLDKFEAPELDITKVILTLKVKELNYDNIDEVLDPKLKEKLSDFRLKKDSAQLNNLLEKLRKPDEEKLQTFWWWQELLKEFLKIHYTDEYSQYEEILKELKVL